MADATMTTASSWHPRTRAGAPWPLSDLLALGALPTAVPCARLHVRNVMYEWDLAAVAETVELVASELVTNAVLASIGLNEHPASTGLPAVHLRLSSDRIRVLVEVWDSNPRLPSPKMAGLDEEGGRGLMLVEALCERWGWYVPDGSGGKVVWGEVATSHT